MYEDLNITSLTAPQAAVVFAVIIGIVFGFLAERTKFCFRRSLIGEDRKQAAGVWLIALATAILGTQGILQAGLVEFDAHRLMSADLPLLAIAVGGALFGAGMVLTRGCVSRLTVLSGTGNLRAAMVLIVFAVAAHATLKGVLAPIRTTLGSVTVPLGDTVSLAALPGGGMLWSAILGVTALAIALRSGNRPLALVGGAVIGLLVPLAWAGTGYVLYDDFDPIALQSLSFTSPWADTLFWTVASTSVPAGFGVGLIGGVLGGSLLAALIFRSFVWQSFSAPKETGRYATGAVMMGVGGVLAGGCTVGAGLAGIPTLSVAAILALAFIALGALITNAIVNRAPHLAHVQPAE